MSWLKDLYETYEAQIHAVGKYNDRGENPLLPVCHKLESTQVVITLDTNGNFLDAQAENLRDTIVPCTESSMSRTNKPAAHPLSDKIEYVAPDFLKYSNSDNNHIKKHESYNRELSLWANSSKLSCLKAICTYISQKSLIADLVRKKILFLDASGKLLKSWNGSKEEKPAIFKILANQTKKQQDIAIRWIIEDKGILHALWKESGLYDSWIDFMLGNAAESGLCLISAESNSVLSDSYPRDIRKSGDGAKLISANEHDNFTYKGKFEKGKIDQVATLGLEANHKAQAALKWLIKKQGYNSYKTFAIVVWGLNNADIPQPLDEDDLFDNEEEITAGTKEGVGRNIASLIRGYSARFPEDEQIIVLAIDAPVKDKGRSSVVHYSRHRRSEYMNKLELWHTQAAWSHYSPKNRSCFFGAPSPRRIAEACYQRKINGKWEIDSKVLRRTIKELLPCIIESKSVPSHLIKILVERSSQRGSYKKSEKSEGNDQLEWEKILAVACSLYNYQSTKEYTMALNTEENSRDYLYGRLLAIADRLEEYALYKQATHLLEDKEEKKKAGKSTRLTNASRMMYAFSQKPYTSWQHIHDKLGSYFERLSKLKSGTEQFYRSQIEEVMSLFDKDDFTNNTPLSGEYLLAFYCQRKELKAKKQNHEYNK